MVAVVQGGATGAGLLLASACDFLVGEEDGTYGFTDAAASLFPSAPEDGFFRERLGDALADDLLYRSTRCSGRELQAKGLPHRAGGALGRRKPTAAELATKRGSRWKLLKAISAATSRRWRRR